jgi:rhomboid protease GluP
MSEPQPPEQSARRPHPLENRPAPPAERQQRQRINLRLPAVAPYVTYALIIINVLAFLARAFSPSVDLDVLLWGANHAESVLRDGEYYRLLTSMFLHASIFDSSGSYAFPNALHLIFNMYILYGVGMSLERVFGHLRFSVVYLLGGLGGSVLSALLGGLDSFSVGASGAVFAILGAEFIFLYHHRVLMGAAGRARRNSLIAFGLINLLFGLASNVPGSQLRVDNWGHVGGLAGGLVLAWFISPIFNLRAHPDHPGELLGEDTNPFAKRYWVVSIYATVLVVLVFIGVLGARG